MPKNITILKFLHNPQRQDLQDKFDTYYTVSLALCVEQNYDGPLVIILNWYPGGLVNYFNQCKKFPPCPHSNNPIHKKCLKIAGFCILKFWGWPWRSLDPTKGRGLTIQPPPPPWFIYSITMGVKSGRWYKYEASTKFIPLILKSTVQKKN